MPHLLPKKHIHTQNITHYIILLLLIITIVTSSTPEDPIKCSSKNSNCTIKNSYGEFPDRSICHAMEVSYPKSEEELIAVVADATKMRRKMKVATRFSHSMPKLACPQDNGLLISTNYLNRTLIVDESSMTITVESGVTLRQLINDAAKVGLALPYAPYWWGLTIGGLMSTGAHGSSLWGLGSSVHDHVIQLRIVTPGDAKEGFAKVRTLGNGNPELEAAKVSLGVLGVISQVTFKLQPMFKRSITFLEKSDSDLGREAPKFGLEHEFGDITWYPGQQKALYRIDDRVPVSTPGNGLNDFSGFRSRPSLILALIRNTEEDQESRNDADGKCIDGKLTTSLLKSASYGYTNNGIVFINYPIIGYQNRLQASGSCLDSTKDGTCPWDYRVKGQFFHQTTVSIGLSKVMNFIEDVQKLVAIEPKALCVLDLYNGVLMRYVKASSAYLGNQEDAIDFDITYFRNKDPLVPRLYEDILEEIEQIGVFKYGGLPHWGKNRNVAFEGVIKKYKNASNFLRVKDAYDPMGLFSSEWTDQILGLRGGITIDKEGCALEGLCICSKDIHCAPIKGYFCREGKVYKDARVCTRIVKGEFA
ncbi:oxidase [Lithospermum erythrorhizon]|uniref:L-gulonolactone oxidase n=1 Tax=Lithospermum erythrorhizon TaxID=34254 RepID=A0AAV3NZJ4_LITER